MSFGFLGLMFIIFISAFFIIFIGASSLTQLVVLQSLNLALYYIDKSVVVGYAWNIYACFIVSLLVRVLKFAFINKDINFTCVCVCVM